MSVGFFRHWFIMYHSTTCLFSPTCFHHWFTYMLSHTELQLRPGGAGKKADRRGGFKEQQRRMAKERQQEWKLERSSTASAWNAMNKALDLAKR